MDSPAPQSAPAKPRRPLVDNHSAYILAKWPRCKWCKSIDLYPTRTICTDGESVTRRVVCRSCGGKQILLME